MIDDPDGQAPLAAFIEDVADALVARASRSNEDPKEEAAQALAQLVRHGNINANELTASQIAAKLHRRGFGRT